VSDLQVGDRVADMTVVGSNATYRTLRADRIARVPAGLDAADVPAENSNPDIMMMQAAQDR
jgi:NADPH:quinone reductase